MSETALMVPSNLSHNVSALIESAKIHLTKLPSLGGSIDPLQHAAVKAKPMAGMMSVVLDANVIVSVFVNPPVPPAQVLNTWPQHPENSK